MNSPATPVRNTFRKHERLSSRKAIAELFQKGKTKQLNPIKMIFSILPVNDGQAGGCSIVIHVPKKLFKRATQRNRLKRRIREAYRLNKSDFLQQLQEQRKLAQLAFVYKNREEESYQNIAEAVQKLLKQMM